MELAAPDEATLRVRVPTHPRGPNKRKRTEPPATVGQSHPDLQRHASATSTTSTSTTASTTTSNAVSSSQSLASTTFSSLREIQHPAEPTGRLLICDGGLASNSSARPSLASRARRLSFPAPRTFTKPGTPRSVTKLTRSVTARLKDPAFSNQYIVASQDGLAVYCRCCFRELNPLDKSGLIRHVQGDRHKANKADKDESARSTAASELTLEQQSVLGINLDLSEDSFRLQMLSWMLRYGVSRSALDGLRPLIDREYRALGNVRQLMSHIATLQQQETTKIFQALCDPIASPKFSIIFDGTTRVDETILILARFVDNDLNIQQVLIRLATLQKSLSGLELADLIYRTINMRRLPWDNLTALICDNVGVNRVAAEELTRPRHVRTLLATCLPHMLDHTGEHFAATALNLFKEDVCALFSKSPRARAEWVAITQRPVPPRPNNTRWWSWWEALAFFFNNWHPLEQFLEQATFSPSVCLDRLRVYKADTRCWAMIRLQMACVIDAGLPFVAATYNLESDGPIVLVAGQVIDELLASAKAFRLTHAQQVISILVTANMQPQAPVEPVVTLSPEALREAWSQVAEAVVRPALEYFLLKFEREAPRARLIELYRIASLCHPRVMALMPEGADCEARVRLFSQFPFIDTELVNALIVELPLYRQSASQGRQALVRHLEVRENDAVAAGVVFNRFACESDWLMPWWRQHTDRLPTWTRLLKILLTLQPSSAAAERAFSLLEHLYPPQRSSALEGHQELSLMLSINQHAFKP